MATNLQKAIVSDERLKDLNIQIRIAKEIASGMNFLHSLQPSVLVNLKLIDFHKIKFEVLASRFETNEYFVESCFGCENW